MQQQQAQLDQRALHLQKLMEQAPEPLRKELRDKVELSWIYHESALEGVVYAPDELAVALRGGTPEDPIMASAFDEIRQNKATIEVIRQWAAEKKTKVDADVVKDIYVLLAPDEVDGKKPPLYRKDIPLHRLYFHEIAAPDKIAPKLKAFGQWINAPDTRRTTHVLRLAAKAHFHLLHIYPYPKHSGKVARLVMNLLLLAAGYPPAVIHSTERQRYYDALKTNENALAQIVKEALTASIESSIRFLESRLPPPAPPPMKKIKLISRKRSEPPTAKPGAPVAIPRPPAVPAMGSRAQVIAAAAQKMKAAAAAQPKVVSAAAKPAVPTKPAVPSKPVVAPPSTKPAVPAKAAAPVAKPAASKPAPVASPTKSAPVVKSVKPAAKAAKAPTKPARAAKPTVAAKPKSAAAKPKAAKPKGRVTSLTKARKSAPARVAPAKARTKILKVSKAGSKPKARRAA